MLKYVCQPLYSNTNTRVIANIFLFVLLHNKSLLNREEFAPKGSKFFPLRIDPFSEETVWEELAPLKVCHWFLMNINEMPLSKT